MLPRLGRLSAWPAGLWRCTWFGRSPKILHQGRAGGNSVARKFEQLVELGLIDVTPSERDAKMSLAFAKRASGDPEKSGEVLGLNRQKPSEMFTGAELPESRICSQNLRSFAMWGL
jgi:hypothetical protein